MHENYAKRARLIRARMRSRKPRNMIGDAITLIMPRSKIVNRREHPILARRAVPVCRDNRDDL